MVANLLLPPKFSKILEKNSITFFYLYINCFYYKLKIIKLLI